MSEAAGDSGDSAGWTPIRVRWDGGRGFVDWCWTAGVEFDDPFFTQTVQRCLRHPARLLFRRETPIEQLPELAGATPRRPSGLVFHTSRSGSTLVARMLARRADTRVVSEAGPIDDVVRAPAPAERRIEWLRAIVALLGDASRPHLVVKHDAWTALDLPLVRAAFPDVPWAFVYRDPVEVLVSQQARPGYHMLPFTLPPALVGMAPEEVTAMGVTEYRAAVLAGIMRAACEGIGSAGTDSRALLVDYDELPEAALRVAAHFGMPVGGGDRATMLAAARQDAKNPALPFDDDRARKQDAAGEEIREAVRKRVGPWYAELERLRLARP